MDQQTLTCLVEKFQRGIWRYIRALGCDPALADDLCQDTFLAVMQRPFQDKGNPATVAYLRIIAYHQYITNHRRRNRRIAYTNNMERIECVLQEAQDETKDQLLCILNECFLQLSPREQTALSMLYRDRASRAEIAAALEVGEHGAKNVLQRAKRRLRAMIEERRES